jgi:hypothetical protein
MATSWISFGPDLEPLVSESRLKAETPPLRRDGLAVAGACEEVAAKLAEATERSGGWCALERVTDAGERQTVYVNAHAVRFVSGEAT